MSRPGIAVLLVCLTACGEPPREATPPSAPTQVAAVAGNAQATVNWTAPADDGGSALLRYTITPSPAAAPVTVTAPANSGVVTGLINGVSYTFTVTATNAAGSSAPSSASAAVVPATTPQPPTDVVAVRGDAEATVSWTAGSDGGSPLLTYTVTAEPGGASVTVNASGTSATISGLTNETRYTFTVVATNALGSSGPSSPSNGVTPTAATAPAAATDVTAVPGNASAVVSWSAPADGGSPIQAYQVTATPGGATTTVSAPATTATVIGLTNGVSYLFTVVAINAIGTGPASTTAAAVVPADVPGAPTGVSGVRGNGQVTVSWAAPESNGGNALQSYTVTASPGGATATASAAESAAVVTGLTNGQAYTFTVRAVNGIGAGAPSAPSASVTPATLPDAPGNLSATSAANGVVTITWTAPSNGGDPLVSYRLTNSADARSLVLSASSTSHQMNGFPHAPVTFTLVATNGLGDSAPAQSAPVTPPAAPGAVSGLSASQTGPGQVLLQWTPPTDDGGSPLVGYLLTATPDTQQVFINELTSSGTVSGLANKTYTLYVQARNAVGPGQFVTTTFTPTTVPDAPAGVRADSGSGSAQVSWTAPGNGGLPITSYTVTASPGGATATVAETETTAQLTGLTVGVSYTFRVVATNAWGDSAASAPSLPVVPFGAPDAANTTFAAIPSSSFASPDAPITATVVVKDAGGNAVRGHPVTFSSDEASDVLTPPSGVTDLHGRLSTHIVGAVTGGRTFTAELGAFTRTTPGTFIPACSAPALTPLGSPLTVGSKPMAILTADLNGDGILDLATANETAGNVSVLLGRNDGTFGSAVSYTMGPAGFPYYGNYLPSSLTAADFDGDGDVDLAAGSAASSNASVGVLLNNGDGTFAPVAVTVFGSWLATNSAGALVNADFNGDGRVDLAFTRTYGSDNYLHVLLGSGDGTFAPVPNSQPGAIVANFLPGAGGSPLHAAAGDFDGDGITDLVIARSVSAATGLLIGNGNGSFKPAVSLGANSVAALAARDLDLDGHLDLAVARTGNQVTVLLGEGNGTFPTTDDYPYASGTPAGVALADLDGDGKVDLVAAELNADALSVRRGTGSGALDGATATFTVGDGPNAIAIGDFNRDGKPDVANTNRIANTVTVLLNTCN